VEAMYERQLATYRTVLERGAAAGAFDLSLDTSTAALNLVALEDAYGLHIVAGNSQMSVGRAVEAMFAAARAFGAPAL
ncbi:TetR/AcrR family transcriptional regulator, partial [Streptomyces sp. SID2955]|nr:TetR/AcrR family transcriptional regulator [Streptomyces sp. SID2955]